MSKAPDIEMVTRVPLFAGLSAADAAVLWDSGRRLSVQPGDVVIREGAPGESLYVILSGELEITRHDKGEDIVLAQRGAGEVIGEMSLLDSQPRSATAKAIRDTELLEVGQEAWRRVTAASASAVSTVLRTMARNLRSTEATLMQSEKLASLGTLAAGLAHELNNPAAAIQRSSEYLREAFERWGRLSGDLHRLDLTPGQRTALADLEASVARCCDCEARGDTSKEEDLLADRLEGLGVTDPWEIAPAMARYAFTRERIELVARDFPGPLLDPVMQWLGTGLTAQQLIEEIRLGSTAISRLVKSVKSYAFLDQSPLQDVDLRTSLEDTLIMLGHKLKQRVEVVRDFPDELPLVEAYAGELNQVWTNLIDNAIQAMDGHGRIELCIRALGAEVEVTITDTGPGIPAEERGRIFDPFFTTKAQGVGTGLGLHIVRNIVVNRHQGRIEVNSRPGRTQFRVVLPLHFARATTAHEAPAR